MEKIYRQIRPRKEAKQSENRLPDLIREQNLVHSPRSEEALDR